MADTTKKSRKFWVLFGFFLGITFAFMLARYLNSEYNKIDKTEAQQEIKDLTVANFNSPNISQWSNDAGYLSQVDISQVKNGSGLYFDYRPNNSQCANNQILRYDQQNSRWTCSNEAAISANSWGSISGSITNQTDLKNALDTKFSINGTIGGDTAGTLSNIEVIDDSHNHTGATISGLTTSNFETGNISQWTNDSGFITGLNFAQVTNGTGVFLDYRPNNIACAQNEILKYDAGLARWICGTDSGAGSVAWGDISGNITNQTDLNSALTGKLGTTAAFGGDVTGTYDAIVITNDSHDHTGATISGLTTADFTSQNISQWTNDAGFITGLTHAQITNAASAYWDYRPNNVACAQNEVLKYDAGLNRWLCATDSGGAGVWGSITGTLSNQADLNSALTGKLATNASFGGDVSGTYDALVVTDNSHNHTGATISGLDPTDFASPNISQWTNNSGYITGLNHSQVTNLAGVYWDYRPNNVACAQNEVLKYDAGLNRWTCATDIGAGSFSWGAITGTLADQTDLSNALAGKLSTGASFGGDLSGTYNNVSVTDDSHNHTGATISGLTTADFTSQNVSQWTNDSGFISGLNFSQVANGSNIYLNYKPNDVACSQDQVLKYDAALSRWVCGNDNGAGTIAWGSITGTLSNQADLSSALSSKLNLTASYGGDVSGTYDNLVVANDSHSHTGATLSNIDIGTIVSGAGKYLDYKPNNVACSNGQILEYDSANSRWICGNDDTSGGGGGSSPVVSLTTVQTRTQSSYVAPNSGDGVEITPLNITMTPKKTGNKIILEWVVNGEVNENTVFTVWRNGTLLTNSDDGGNNRWSGIATAPYDANDSSTPMNLVIKIVDENSLDVATTYSLKAKSSWLVQNNTFWLNRTVVSTGGENLENSLSTGTATEVDPAANGGGVSTVGSMTGSSVFSGASADDQWLGLGAAAARIEFDDQATDEIQLLGANVGIGQIQPQHTLDVNGNIGIVASGYLNFGTTDGNSGYGIRDNNGTMEYKNNSGSWVPIGSGGGGSGELIIIADDSTPSGSTLNESFNFTTSTTGDYLLYVTATAYTTSITQKTLVAKIDGNTVGTAGIFMNATAFHYSMPPVIVKLSNVTAGAHTLNVSITGTHTIDNNDRVHAYVLAINSGGSVTVGSMSGSSVFSDATADDDWIGLGSSSGRIEFDDQAVDEIQILNASLGIGVTQPQHLLDVNGNIGIAASGYLNFGTTDGTSGYGIRDNNGKVEVKNSGGTWKEIDDNPSWAINPDKPPASPDAMDDEFNDASIDNKWTQYTDAGATAVYTEADNVLEMKFNQNAANSNRVFALLQTAPAGTWKVRTKMIREGTSWNYNGPGLMVRNVTNNKSTSVVFMHHSSYGDGLTGLALRLTGAGLTSEYDLGNMWTQTIYLELEYDGTNYIWRVSTSGVRFQQIYTETAAAFVGTPEQVGLEFHPYSTENYFMPITSFDWFRRIQ